MIDEPIYGKPAKRTGQGGKAFIAAKVPAASGGDRATILSARR